MYLISLSSAATRAFIENYELIELPNGKTQFTHALYMDPSNFLWIMGWIVSCIIQSILSRAGKKLEVNVANKTLLKELKMKKLEITANEEVNGEVAVTW